MHPAADHVRAALAAARGAGLAVERGKVVNVAANVLVRLDPGPIPARMSGPAEVAAAVDRAMELLAGVPQRIAHGHTHPDNVLWTDGGPPWGH